MAYRFPIDRCLRRTMGRLLGSIASRASGLFASRLHSCAMKPRQPLIWKSHFHPSKGATELVNKAISEAHRSIRVAGYSFTSRPIAKALVEAHTYPTFRCNLPQKSKHMLNALAPLSGVLLALPGEVGTLSLIHCRDGQDDRWGS